MWGFVSKMDWKWWVVIIIVILLIIVAVKYGKTKGQLTQAVADNKGTVIVNPYVLPSYGSSIA